MANGCVITTSAWSPVCFVSLAPAGGQTSLLFSKWTSSSFLSVRRTSTRGWCLILQLFLGGQQQLDQIPPLVLIQTSLCARPQAPGLHLTSWGGLPQPACAVGLPHVDFCLNWCLIYFVFMYFSPFFEFIQWKKLASSALCITVLLYCRVIVWGFCFQFCCLFSNKWIHLVSVNRFP